MNKIRKSTEQEEDIITMKFKFEKARFVIESLKVVVCAIILALAILLLLKVENAFPLAIALILIGSFVTVTSILNIVFKIAGCKKSEITVSNKRIYGKYGPYLLKKTISYRLDDINNVEIKDVLGAKTLVINFQDGKGPKSSNQVTYGSSTQTMSGQGVLRIECVENFQEVYNKLNEIILSIKNNVDLETDIEMAKVEAIEKIAKANTSSDMSYIEEIEKLNSLYERGIITKEEFEQEKKEILECNHKEK